MSPGDTTVEHIDAVDAFARNLYLRLKQFPSSNADPPLDDVALAVKQLHLALRHLRVEAADRDSPLNRPDSAAVHARQLESLVEDCGFQLKQLDTALATIDIYEGSSSEARTDRLGNLRAKIANEKTGIDMFLDTIQLRNPADRPAGIVDGSQTGLENIKDKVDAIANSLFAQRARNANGANLTDDEDRLWQEFKSELEKEGFSPQVLRRHKVCLYALIVVTSPFPHRDSVAGTFRSSVWSKGDDSLSRRVTRSPLGWMLRVGGLCSRTRTAEATLQPHHPPPRARDC